jgi:uncharacterized protein YqfA (UPF0365 family)
MPGIDLRIPAAIAAVALLASLAIWYGRPWFLALRNGVPLDTFRLVGMYLRRVPPRLIVECLIAAKRAGISLRTDDLEAQYMAGGQVERVVEALVAAKQADGVELDFIRACAMNLAGRDPVLEVQQAIHGWEVDVPDPAGGEEGIPAADRDGTPLPIRVRIGVRKCLERVIGGAPLETLVARVSAAAVDVAGRRSSAELAAAPEALAGEIMARGLDEGTAYTLTSVRLSARPGGPGPVLGTSSKETR